MRTVDPRRWPRTNKNFENVTKSFTTRYVGGDGLGSCLRRSFLDAIEEFWSNEPVRAPPRVRAWVTAVAVACCAALAALAAIYSPLLADRPLTINPLNEARHVDFPAVAVCSNNAISRAALHQFALHLSSLDGNRTYSPREIRRNLLQLGALACRRPGAVHAHFTAFLARVGVGGNVSRLLHTLAPRCSALLVRCSWRGAAVPCGQLFAERLSHRGYCCEFNSRYHPVDADTPARRLELAGRDFGLGFVVREDSDDFAYRRRAEDAVEVIIWEGSEYPMATSGAMVVVDAHRNSSVLVKMRARVLTADTCPRRLAGERLVRGGHAWCVARGHAAALRALCSCTLHVFRELFADEADTHEVCSLDHLACINKYSDVFHITVPEPAAGAAGGGPWYARCLPDCTRTVYAVSATHAQLADQSKFFKNILTNSIALDNVTEVRIFFTSTEQELQLAEAPVGWYEVAAVFGGQCAALGGVSLVGALQLLYHCTVRWRHHLLRRRQQRAADRRLWSRLDRR